MVSASSIDVAVQLVKTTWTKASRGGGEASRRNSVPTLFPAADQARPCWQEISQDELDGFTPRMTVTTGIPGKALIALTESADLLRVLPRPISYGSPHRRRRPPAVRLARTEWLRWRINYRYHSHQGWIYRLDTWNIAYRPASSEVFVGPPRFDVDELAWMR